MLKSLPCFTSTLLAKFLKPKTQNPKPKTFGSIAQTMLSGQNHEEKPARQGFAVVSS
jgi:hypothetical protein